MGLESSKTNVIPEERKTALIVFLFVVLLILLILILILFLFSPKIVGDKLRKEILNEIKNELAKIIENSPTNLRCGQNLWEIKCLFESQGIYYRVHAWTNIKSRVDYFSEPVIELFELEIELPQSIDYDYNGDSRAAEETIKKIYMTTKLKNLKLEDVKTTKYLLNKTKNNSNEKILTAQAFVFGINLKKYYNDFQFDKYKTYFDFNLDGKIDEIIILSGDYEEIKNTVGSKLIESRGFTREQYLEEAYKRWGYTGSKAENYADSFYSRPIPNTGDEWFSYSLLPPTSPFLVDCHEYDTNARMFFKNNEYSAIVCVGGRTLITISNKKIN